MGNSSGNSATIAHVSGSAGSRVDFTLTANPREFVHWAGLRESRNRSYRAAEVAYFARTRTRARLTACLAVLAGAVLVPLVEVEAHAGPAQAAPAQDAPALDAPALSEPTAAEPAAPPPRASAAEAVREEPTASLAEEMPPHGERTALPSETNADVAADSTLTPSRFDVLDTTSVGFAMAPSFGSRPALLPRLQLPPLALDNSQGFGASLAQTQPAAQPAQKPEPIVVDDRSGWARWNSTLTGVTTSLVAFDVLCVGAFTLLPNDVTGWEDPEFKGLKENFTVGPRVDNDRWFWNYVAHPWSGSEYYLIARNREHSWYASAAYSMGMSTFWEFFVESSYEQASWQDIFITPVAGTVLGELRWQAKKALVHPSTGRPIGVLNKTLYVLIDPFDALTKL